MGLFSRDKKNKLVKDPMMNVPNPGTVGKKGRIVGASGYNDIPKGWVSLEYMGELMPPLGLAKFQRMVMNDPIVGGLMLHMLFAIERVKWDIVGDNEDLVKEQIAGMAVSMEQLFLEMATAFTFGFYIGEMVWDIVGGKPTLIDIIPRHQTSIQAIDDKDGNVVQFDAEVGSVSIPYSKCLHHSFITMSRNPWGISLLRHIYKPYYYKVSIEATEAVGLDRDLSGLPVMTAPEGFDFTAADPGSPNYQPAIEATLQWATEIVTNVRKDQLQGIVKPNGWTFDIVRGENRTTIPTNDIITRYNTEMAAGLVENFMALSGAASRGTATASHIDNFVTACEGYASIMADHISYQVFKKICNYNGQEKFPTLKTRVANFSILSSLGDYISKLVTAGVVMPNQSLEKAALDCANLPKNEDDIGWEDDGSPTPKVAPPVDPNKKLPNQGGPDNAQRD
jgi:hypothetical protein